MNANQQTVEIVVPVHNEERALALNVEVLLDYLRIEFPFAFGVVVADNASIDATPEIAISLSARHPEVHALRFDRKGRGLALRSAWLLSTADVVSYMAHPCRSPSTGTTIRTRSSCSCSSSRSTSAPGRSSPGGCARSC
jgi:glycosyltransferase involved in cell wall biosynthesis